MQVGTHRHLALPGIEPTTFWLISRLRNRSAIWPPITYFTYFAWVGTFIAFTPLDILSMRRLTNAAYGVKWTSSSVMTGLAMWTCQANPSTTLELQTSYQ